jgi:hypothetical protein
MLSGEEIYGCAHLRVLDISSSSSYIYASGMPSDSAVLAVGRTRRNLTTLKHFLIPFFFFFFFFIFFLILYRRKRPRQQQQHVVIFFVRRRDRVMECAHCAAQRTRPRCVSPGRIIGSGERDTARKRFERVNVMPLSFCIKILFIS